MSKKNLPFQLKAEVDYRHKAYFVKYVNKLVPKLKDSLIELMPRCKDLFGTIPEFDEYNDIFLPYVDVVNKCL